MCRILMDCTVASTLNAAFSIPNDWRFGMHADGTGPGAVHRCLPLNHRLTSRQKDPPLNPSVMPSPRAPRRMQMERRLRAASGQMGLRRPLVRTRAQAAVWEAFLVS